MFHKQYTPAFFNELGQKGLHAHLGIQVTQVMEKMITAELSLSQVLFAGNGYVHAGSLVTLADTTCGYGCLAHLPESAISFTTIELKSNFLGTTKTGSLICSAVPAHLGKTTQVWDATIKNSENGKNMSLFRCTQLIIY